MQMFGVIINYITWAILAAAVLLLLIWLLVRKGLNSAPRGGISKQMYVELGGVKQWIAIHGKDKNNPVLLYLHGGPGVSTSTYDHAFTRLWSDVYTVVTWDQRNCGKSWSPEQWDTKLTYDMMMEDALELILFLRRYLGVEKVTLLGHSWGTYLGANLAREYPQFVDAYIGVGQLVDFYENEEALKAEAEKWTEDDPVAQLLVDKLSPEDLAPGHFEARNKLLQKYHFDMFARGRDYNLTAAKFFNPNYTLREYMKFYRASSKVYRDFISSEEFERFSLTGRTSYQVPYFNVNGDQDYQCNHRLARAYFDQVEAPFKKLYMMENMTHGLMASRSKEFSRILHEIASEMKSR